MIVNLTGTISDPPVGGSPTAAPLRRGIWTLWAPVGQASLNGATVPAGERWEVYAASVFTDCGDMAEWRIEAITSQGFRVGLVTNTAAATPVCALNRTVPLYPGDHLGCRVSGLPADKSLGLNYLYLAYPAEDIPQSIG